MYHEHDVTGPMPMKKNGNESLIINSSSPVHLSNGPVQLAPEAWTQYRSQEVDSPCVTPQFKSEPRMISFPDPRRRSVLVFSMDEPGLSAPVHDYPLFTAMNELSRGIQSLGGVTEISHGAHSPALTDQPFAVSSGSSDVSTSALGITMISHHSNIVTQLPATPPSTPLSHQALLVQPLDTRLAGISTSAPSVGSCSTDMYYHEVANMCQQHYQLLQQHQQHSHLGLQLTVQQSPEHARWTTWPTALPRPLDVTLSPSVAVDPSRLTKEGQHQLLCSNVDITGSMVSPPSTVPSSSSSSLPSSPSPLATQTMPTKSSIHRRPSSMIAYTTVDFPSPSSPSTSLTPSIPSSPAPDAVYLVRPPMTEHTSSNIVDKEKCQPSIVIMSPVAHVPETMPETSPTTTMTTSTATICDEKSNGYNINNNNSGEKGSNSNGTNSSQGQKKSKPEYACQFANCHRTFTRPFNLKSHEHTHETQRPHGCDQCPKTFSRIHDRDRHARNHVNKKPYTCPVCENKFARQDAVTRHLKLSEGNSGCAVILRTLNFRFCDAAAGRIQREALGNADEIKQTLAKINAEVRRKRCLLRQQRQKQQQQDRQQHRVTKVTKADSDDNDG
ncbi:hypothetical protein BGW41_000784 [Actinomortierella wolfii]|nr:hypothetical protein BGW41_000784 [Actinomortierella wolfii]